MSLIALQTISRTHNSTKTVNIFPPNLKLKNPQFYYMTDI